MTPLEWHGQLASIGLRTADVQRSARFYEDLLGMVAAEGATGDWTQLGWGMGAPVLEFSAGTPGLSHFALEIPDPIELEGLIARLDRHGVSVDTRGDGTYVVADPDGRELRLHGRVDRSAEHVSSAGRRPIRLQHITLATEAMAEVLDFYCGALDMRLSDRMEHEFAWLRCGAEHHTVAILGTGSPTLVDHLSFDLSRWDDFRDWGDRLAASGVDLTWGPGRHGPGNNLFVMFDDPDDFHIELSAEMELFYDDRVEYEPRVWEATTRTVNLWGQVPPWRAARAVA